MDIIIGIIKVTCIPRVSYIPWMICQIHKLDYLFWVIATEFINYIVDEFGSYDPEKVIKFMDLTDHPRDIADPWYTGNFDDTYDDIHECCNILMEKIKREL